VVVLNLVHSITYELAWRGIGIRRIRLVSWALINKSMGHALDENAEEGHMNIFLKACGGFIGTVL